MKPTRTLYSLLLLLGCLHGSPLLARTPCPAGDDCPPADNGQWLPEPGSDGSVGTDDMDGADGIDGADG
ncbi:TPA: AarF/ABC1/UbiB kinase family protein, partial [Aeromonas hydrophila]|nr:AarF/ABC1/UbiB kinase family protein [Aeromonas hydrophila]